MKTNCPRNLGFHGVWFALFAATLLMPRPVMSQTNRFFYDNLGRIAVVLGTNGTDVAIYQYDAVGNITAIVRQTVGPVNLFSFSPETGESNTTVTLQGTGFSTNLSQNTVVFCGSTTAQVISATVNQLKVLAPVSGTNCLIAVTTPSGTSTNTRTFGATINVQVTPSLITVPVLQTQQFTATVFGTSNQAVTWNINGSLPPGTSSDYGMISTNGLYTAPTNAPPGNAVTVRALSVADSDPLKGGAASVTITSVVSQSGPIYSPTVSAQPGTPIYLGPIYSPTVSVCKQPCP